MAEPASIEAAPGPGGPTFEGSHVLLVDDDEVLLRVWSRMLTRRGMTVRAVSKVQAARRVIAGWKRRTFDYALIDDRLPDGFGLELVPALAELRPAPGFAVVSGRPSTERALHALRESVVIVPKPASPTGLMELLGFLDARRGKTRTRYNRATKTAPPVQFGAFTLDDDGLHGPHGHTKLTAVGHGLLSLLLAQRGAWVETAALARDFYQRDDGHGRMLARRQISLLRRALGEQRFIVESALQRGYRIAPAAFETAT
ncbi:MAG: response regulator [Polyangiales bacterium]